MAFQKVSRSMVFHSRLNSWYQHQMLMKVIHYSKVVNSVLSNYFLRITEANVLSSVSSVVCLHKILILHIAYTCTCFMQYLFIVHSIWFYQCSFVLSSKLLKHIIANQHTGVSPHYMPFQATRH